MNKFLIAILALLLVSSFAFKVKQSGGQGPPQDGGDGMGPPQDGDDWEGEEGDDWEGDDWEALDAAWEQLDQDFETRSQEIIHSSLVSAFDNHDCGEGDSSEAADDVMEAVEQQMTELEHEFEEAINSMYEEFFGYSDDDFQDSPSYLQFRSRSRLTNKVRHF